MAEIQENLHTGTDAPPFRIDQKLHQILYKSEARAKLVPMPENVLPEPVYPRKPNPVEMTERGNLNAVFARDFKDGLAGAGADILAIDE